MLLAQTFGKESFGEFSYYFTIASVLYVLFDLGGEFYQIREFTKEEKLSNFNSIFVKIRIEKNLNFYVWDKKGIETKNCNSELLLIE